MRNREKQAIRGHFGSDLELVCIFGQDALDADSKLIVSWLVGGRDAGTATEFTQDLASRLANRVQLTSDGNRLYLSAVEDAFGADIDYAMLVKYYGDAPQGQRRYSPAVCTGATRMRVHRRSRRVAHQHQLRRAPEPDDADVDAALHSADERLLEEGREPRPRTGALLCLVQLLSRTQDAPRHPPRWKPESRTRCTTWSGIVGLIDARVPQPGPRGPYRKRKRAA